MNAAQRQWRGLLHDHRLWLEAFVLVNIAFLALDIYLAHSINQFHHWAEYVPLYFSLVAPIVLVIAVWVGVGLDYYPVWRDMGYLVGWLAIGIGLVGVILHLQSRFFEERTLKSLVYAAPFAAPLAYTGLGFLLVLNRMVDGNAIEWPHWVLLMALGGFVGNFIFSLTDHAQNAFFHWTEWIPVVPSALAIGFLLALHAAPIGRRYLWLCGAVTGVQAIVGVLGFYYHTAANLARPSGDLFDNFIKGAPALAPLLFPNLALLAGIGLVVLWRFTSEHLRAEPMMNDEARMTNGTGAGG